MIDQTTALDLDAIKARAEAARRGPWQVEPYDHPFTTGYQILDPAGDPVAGNFDSEVGGILEGPDAEFIAAARRDVPALIAEVKRLRAELDRRSVPASVAVDAERVLEEIRADQRARGGDPR